MASSSSSAADDPVTRTAAKQHEAKNTLTSPREHQYSSRKWIRGVNLGGWLVLERYITPYQFALTDCHVTGNLCWYPGQVSAPPVTDPNYQVCDTSKCKPILFPNVYGQQDYPIDEYTLGQTFQRAGGPAALEAAEQWFNAHFENFMTRQDLVDLKNAGVTHVRVPLPHWILGHVQAGEPWIVGNRWEMFVRLCRWVREIGGMEVWPDIHTAPGSQNGFDNSGQQGPYNTCWGWMGNPNNIQRSLQAIHNITAAIKEQGLDDVVTGFGLLNEPFQCDRNIYLNFMDQGLQIVRRNLGSRTAVYVSDLFAPPSTFNDGKWWLDPAMHHDTYLDSHYYQIFSSAGRSLSPRQHIAYACISQFHRAEQDNHHATMIGNSRNKKNNYDNTCCYQDAPANTIPSAGVQRIAGEWSAAVDTLPVLKLYQVMQGIAATGIAPEFNRTLDTDRQDFLKHYIQAQAVAYEGVGGSDLMLKQQTEPSNNNKKQFLSNRRPKNSTNNESNSKAGDDQSNIVLLRRPDNHDVDDDVSDLWLNLTAAAAASPPSKTGAATAPLLPTTSSGWFYWTVKMEGGAFAEWDFLRGVREGWMPELAQPWQDSQDLYGSCTEILFRTNDATTIIQPFPDTASATDNYVTLNDDIILSHGDSLLHGYHQRHYRIRPDHPGTVATDIFWIVLVGLFLAFAALARRFGVCQRAWDAFLFWKRGGKRADYTPVEDIENDVLIAKKIPPLSTCTSESTLEASSHGGEEEISI